MATGRRQALGNTHTSASARTTPPQARKVGAPVMLDTSRIRERRARIEREYGTRGDLERRKVRHLLSVDEFWALDELEWLGEGVAAPGEDT